MFAARASLRVLLVRVCIQPRPPLIPLHRRRFAVQHCRTIAGLVPRLAGVRQPIAAGRAGSSIASRRRCVHALQFEPVVPPTKRSSSARAA